MTHHSSIQLEKFVHGGQAIGRLADGRIVFVWGGLPDEIVDIDITFQKKDYAMGFVTRVRQPSDYRCAPKDEAYLSTSPWQVVDYQAEQSFKSAILRELLEREAISWSSDIELKQNDNQWHYRNKMEYSFFGDDEGLHLALHKRSSRQKQIVEGSSLAMKSVDATAQSIRDILSEADIRAGSLKSLVVRASQSGETAVALYVRDEDFRIPDKLSDVCQGLVVYYSTPKSPASVPTKKLIQHGTIDLTDIIENKSFSYSVDGFFQVNIPMFEQALKDIEQAVNGYVGPVIDMYAGVGAIGLSVGASSLVELDKQNIKRAQENASKMPTTIVQASTEQALETITPESLVIFDPPRSGLHPKLVSHLQQQKPQRIVYLSCNPATQARDIAYLLEAYELTGFTGYNFFPKTPHIESLAILERTS